MKLVTKIRVATALFTRRLEGKLRYSTDGCFERVDRRQPREDDLPAISGVAAGEDLPALCADVHARRIKRIDRHGHPHHVGVRASLRQTLNQSFPGSAAVAA